MQPTHENIDRWLFDYTEGNLSPDQEQQLEQFLLNHPELELDLDAWEMAKVDDTPVSFRNKESLYKKRSYKPALALLGLLFLFISGLAYIQNRDYSIDQKQVSAAEGQKTQSKRTIERKEKTLQKKSAEKGFTATVNQTNVSEQTQQAVRLKTTFSEKNRLRASSIVVPTVTNSSLNQLKSLNSETSSFEPESSSETSDIEFARMEFKSLKGMFINREKFDVLSHESVESQEVELKKVSFGNLDLVRKIDRLLSKEIGLTNNQSYDYNIAGYSNLDLNFSSVGTTSQTRFSSISSIRSMETPSQVRINNQLSIDGYSRGMRAGFGAQVNYNDFGNGLIKDVHASLIFSPKIALSRKISLEPAIRFNMGTMTLNEQKLIPNGKVEYTSGQINQFQFNPNLAIGRTLWYRDVDLGMTVHTPLFFLSGQISNIFKHNENIYSNDGSTLAAAQNLTFITGTQYISRNEKLIFAPYALYQHSPYQKQIFAGFTFKAGKAQVGVSYSNLSSANVSFGYVGNHFSFIGQSGYGTLISTQNRTFTHQVTLRIHSSVSKKARRYISL